MRTYIQKLQDRRARGIVLLGILVATVLAIMIVSANAADKGGPKPAPAASEETDRSWTGFGIDAHGSLATGSAAFVGSPVEASITGQTAGVSAYYNHQFGVIVLGADVGYDRVWGDLHTYGVDYAVTLGLRAGVLPVKSTLIYTRGEWIRAVGTGNHVDGWGLGGGVETKISNSPLSVGLEWMHDWFDNSSFGPNVDVTADRITARLKIDLYNKSVSSVFADR